MKKARFIFAFEKNHSRRALGSHMALASAALWAFVGLLLLVSFWGYATFSRRKRKSDRVSSIRRHCSDRGGDTAIFVMVYAYRDASAANTVFSLFENAACPFRVFVGVYEETGPRDPDVWSVYDSMWPRSALRRSHAPNLRVLSYPSSTSGGVLNAYVAMMNRLWRGERIVMAVRSGGDVVPAWDRRVVDALGTAPGDTAPGAVLTHIPAVRGRGRARVDDARAARNSVMDLIQTTTSARWASPGPQQDPAREGRPTFPCVEWPKSSAMPKIKPRLFPHANIPSGRVAVAAVSTGFFACAADTFHAMQTTADTAATATRPDSESARWPPTVPLYAADLFLTEAFVKAGAAVVAAGLPVVYVPHRTTRARTFRPRGWNERKSRPVLSDEFQHYIGINWKRKMVSGRAQMGLVYTEDIASGETGMRQEALVKYGSFEEFQRVRRLFS